MDYRTLLIRYMALVIREEDVSYLHTASPNDFKDHELLELRQIESAIEAAVPTCFPQTAQEESKNHEM